jgi:hypothetical protein
MMIRQKEKNMRVLPPLLLPLFLLGCSPSEATMRERFRKELTAGGTPWEGVVVERVSGDPRMMNKNAYVKINGDMFEFGSSDSGSKIAVVISNQRGGLGSARYDFENGVFVKHKLDDLPNSPGYKTLLRYSSEFAAAVRKLWPQDTPTE